MIERAPSGKVANTRVPSTFKCFPPTCPSLVLVLVLPKLAGAKVAQLFSLRGLDRGSDRQPKMVVAPSRSSCLTVTLEALLCALISSLMSLTSLGAGMIRLSNDVSGGVEGTGPNLSHGDRMYLTLPSTRPSDTYFRGIIPSKDFDDRQ
jgi:hypothetical protein